MRYEVPADFGKFWQAALAEVSKVEAEPEQEPFGPGELPGWPAVEAQLLTFQGVGNVRFRALLQRGSRVGGRRPALVHFPGYGGEVSLHQDAVMRGYVALEVSPRGMSWAGDDFDRDRPTLITQGLADPLRYAYRGVYQDCAQAVLWLLRQPYVDPERIGLFGTSQGGGLTLATAAVTQAARAMAVDLPFLCDYGHTAEGCPTAPYSEIADYLAAHPEEREQAYRTLAYFDALHMAGRINAPALVTAGNADDVCPAQSIRRVYEALQGDRALIEFAGLGHARSADFRFHALNWFDWYL